MAEVLTAVETTLDDLVPVMSGSDLIDVQVVFTIRYTDHTNATVATRQQTISAFSLMTPEQQQYILALSAGMKQFLYNQYVAV
jgi:hypothetical protein